MNDKLEISLGQKAEVFRLSCIVIAVEENAGNIRDVIIRNYA